MIHTKTTPEQLNKISKGSMMEHLGIEITETGTDYLCGKMPVDHRTKQPYGLLHGGASVVLAETLGSIGSNILIDQSTHYIVGLEINANHIKSVKDGYVFGKASIVHAGSKTHIWEIKITNEQNQLLCISRLTVMVIEKKA
jgi:1,4-dihydroxy-2-naphthoyl-CoA hydrolase